MKSLLASAGRGARAKRRIIDELIEMLRRWQADLRHLFRWRNNRFDPGDPRLLTIVLVVLGLYLAAGLLYALLTGQR